MERYGRLFDDERSVERLLNLGCLFQINVYSVYDESSEVIKKNARQLLANRQVHFLGKDAHWTNHRPPCVENGMAYIYETCEKAYADEIAFGNAEKLLLM